jgi:hypothetical protein
MQCEYKALLDVDMGYLMSLDSTIDVILDDKNIVTMYPSTIQLSSYIWPLLVKYIPDNIGKQHCLPMYYVGGSIVADSLNQLASSVLKTMNKLHGDTRRYVDLSMSFNRDLVYVNNDIYNHIITHYKSGINGINVFELMAISENEKLKELKDKLIKAPSGKGIEDVYNGIDKLIRYDPVISTFTISQSYVNNTINGKQLMQILGVRGYGAELDGTIFRYPILHSFLDGLRDMYSYTVESRGAVKAQVASTTTISDTEFLGRRAQLIAEFVSAIDYNHCDNDHTIEITVIGGNTSLLGHYYKDNVDDKEFKVVEDETPDLTGQTIYLLSTMHCRSKNKHAICTRCGGKMLLNYNPKDNIGYLGGSTFSDDASQGALKTKHHISSATSRQILIPHGGEDIFKLREKTLLLNGIYLKDFKEVFMRINTDSMHAITTINDPDHVYYMDNTKLSNIDYVKFVFTSKSNKYSDKEFEIKQDSRHAVFTSDFVSYIVSIKPTIANDGRYEIPLGDWLLNHSKKDVFEFPEIESSMSDLVSNVESLLFTRKKTRKDEIDETPESLFTKIYNIYCSRTGFNVGLLGIMIYSLMAYDPNNENYDMARGSEDARLESFKNITIHRTMSVMLVLGYLVEKLSIPETHLLQAVTEHPLNVIYFKQARTINEHNELVARLFNNDLDGGINGYEIE